MENGLIFGLRSKQNKAFVGEPHQLNFQNTVTDTRPRKVAAPGMKSNMTLSFLSPVKNRYCFFNCQKQNKTTKRVMFFNTWKLCGIEM